MTNELSIIIPTYNERENIGTLLGRLLTVDTEHEIGLECIVVDDDSPDRTWEFVETEFADEPRVRVIRRTDEQGLGSAVVRGMEAAKGEFIGVIDADLQHPPERVADMHAAFEPGIDVVVGTRRAKGGDIEEWPLSRQIISKGAEVLAYASLPEARKLSDPMSGFFMVRASAVDPEVLDPTGFKILLEVLARCDISGVTEVPYTFRNRANGESNLDAGEYIKYVEHLCSLGIISRGLDRYVDPDRAVRMAEFGLIGATGTAVNTVVFLLVFNLGVEYWLAGMAAFLAAVNWNFGGNWLLTYDKPSTSFKGQYAKFHVTSIGGFVVYSLTLWLLFAQYTFPPTLANLGAILSGATVNFIGTEWFAIGPHS